MKILIIIGTRPEAIKMAILYKLLLQNKSFDTHLCTTGQHTELLSQALNDFGIQADTSLILEKRTNDLIDKMGGINIRLNTLFQELKPDLVIVQGDTLSSYCGAISAKLNHIQLCHVEAGLRSGNKESPFPEEMFRQMISRLADIHFAPSIKSRQNLISEGININDIHVTGNTGIDAFLYAVSNLDDYTPDDNLSSFIRNQKDICKRRLLLLTMHRRENQGKEISDIYSSLSEIVKNNNLALVCVEHPNPNTKAQFATTGMEELLFVSTPLPYTDFIFLMDKADLILSDSGGIQEEAPYLGKPLIVLRTETERKEIIDDNSFMLYKIETLERDILKLLERNHDCKKLYGDGTASKKIVEILGKYKKR